MECRNTEYFNSKDTYLFRNSLGQEFESKVEREDEKGHWWTVEHPKRSTYKATSLLCVKL